MDRRFIQFWGSGKSKRSNLQIKQKGVLYEKLHSIRMVRTKEKLSLYHPLKKRKKERSQLPYPIRKEFLIHFHTSVRNG